MPLLLFCYSPTNISRGLFFFSTWIIRCYEWVWKNWIRQSNVTVLKKTKRSGMLLFTVNCRRSRTEPCEYWWWQNLKGYVVSEGFFRIVAGLCEKLSRHVLNIASFEFLPKWQMMKQETQPFLLISLPSRWHPQWQLDHKNRTRFLALFAKQRDLITHPSK